MADHLPPRASSPDIQLHRVMLARHRRGPWVSAEDAYLLELVRTQGASNWVRISQLIATRSPKQCRERFHQNLKPSLNLDPISAEEGIMIERMVAEMGKRWAEIARRLHGRSDNAVKNWWNGGMNRRKRLDNRRAEMAPRAAYHHQQHEHQHQHQHQHPQSQYSPYPSRHHTQPYPHTYAVPHHQPRYQIDAPLPSPSAYSTASRADSADDCAAPSLTSSTSHASHSYPTTPQQQQQSSLPSLALLDPHNTYSHNRLTPHYYNNNNIPTPPLYPSASKPANYAAARPYPLLAEGYSGAQLPLPSFQSMVKGEPSSPAKDKRMDLSQLLA